MRRTLRVIHVGVVFLITAAILLQAALAGQFISGLTNALPVHGAVGGILELVAILLLIVAIAHRMAGERTRMVLSGSILLAVALEAQAALGWAPGAVPTSVHVPLGACILAFATAMSVVMVRMVRSGRRAGAEGAPADVAVHAGPGGVTP